MLLSLRRCQRPSTSSRAAGICVGLIRSVYRPEKSCYCYIKDFHSCLSIATCNIFTDDNMVSVNGKCFAEVETLLEESVDESKEWSSIE